MNGFSPVRQLATCVNYLLKWRMMRLIGDIRINKPNARMKLRKITIETGKKNTRKVKLYAPIYFNHCKYFRF